jgi:hypothetical protein
MSKCSTAADRHGGWSGCTCGSARRTGDGVDGCLDPGRRGAELALEPARVGGGASIDPRDVHADVRRPRRQRRPTRGRPRETARIRRGFGRIYDLLAGRRSRPRSGAADRRAGLSGCGGGADDAAGALDHPGAVRRRASRPRDRCLLDDPRSRCCSRADSGRPARHRASRGRGVASRAPGQCADRCAVAARFAPGAAAHGRLQASSGST